jgi:hypothetical protein
MKKQTAVEWMVEQVELISNNKTLPKKDAVKLYDEVIQQAKEMEKKQIIDACNLQRNDYRGMPTYNKSGEQYYNETYK